MSETTHATKSELRREIAELRSVGSHMSNICFNLAQRAESMTLCSSSFNFSRVISSNPLREALKDAAAWIRLEGECSCLGEVTCDGCMLLCRIDAVLEEGENE